MIHKRAAIVSAVFAVALSVPFFGRAWNLFLHELGAILFLGNIVVSALWMSLAKRAGGAEAFRLGVRGIMLTDAVFTTPGALLLFLNGGILAPEFLRPHALWLFLGMGFFVVTAIIWAAVLLPAQRRLWRALERMPAGGPVPPECAALYSRWFRFGGVATLLPLAALVMMVLKPTLG
jgi:uncharacterized membrane protein